MTILLFIVGLILFVGLVVIHELGHFFAARRGGVVVEEFGIGFPPRAWSRKLKSGLLFTINWLPLGGFVKLKGENDSATGKGSFGAAPLGTKVKIMLAGVGMNLLTAFLLFTFLALIGLPKLIDNQFTVDSDTIIVQNQVLVGAVEKDSPANKAGLEKKDRLLGIGATGNIKQIEFAENLPELTKAFAGKSVAIQIERSGKSQTLQATLRSEKEVAASRKTSDPKGYLGVSPAESTIRRSTWSAPIVAAGLIKQLTVANMKGLGSALGNLLTGQGKKASEGVGGPLTIVAILNDSSQMGFRFMLVIVAMISLVLAIMNALPIPALDGGRLFVTLLYRLILRKPLTQETEERIHGTGFMILMLLIVLITIVDIQRLWG